MSAEVLAPSPEVFVPDAIPSTLDTDPQCTARHPVRITGDGTKASRSCRGRLMWARVLKLESRSSRIALDVWLEQRENITLLVVLWFMRTCIHRGTTSLIASRTVIIQ